MHLKADVKTVQVNSQLRLRAFFSTRYEVLGTLAVQHVRRRLAHQLHQVEFLSQCQSWIGSLQDGTKLYPPCPMTKISTLVLEQPKNAYTDPVHRCNSRVKLVQCLCGIWVVANLNKLNAELILRHSSVIKTPGGIDDDLFGVIRWIQDRSVTWGRNNPWRTNLELHR